MAKTKHILLASANVLNGIDYLSLLKEERDNIRSALHQLSLSGKLRISESPETSFSDLFNKFNTYGSAKKTVLLHYCGHSDEESLVLQKRGGGIQEVCAADVAAFLELQRGLEVVFLNSCSSETIGEHILRGNVGAVIETTRAIGDGEASRFAVWVYQGLYAGKSLEEAFNQAVVTYKNEEGVTIENEETDRGIVCRMSKGQEKLCTWRLSYKKKAFVENWYLVERLSAKVKRHPNATKVFFLHNNNKETEKYANAVINIFANDPEILPFKLEEVLEEEENETIIREADKVVIFLSEQFSSFWNSIEWIEPLLDLQKIALIACNGDVSNARHLLLNKNIVTINTIKLPPVNYTLEKMTQLSNLEKVVNDFCGKSLMDFAGSNNKTSKENLIKAFYGLNFGDQKKPFETDQEVLRFEFKKFNFLLIEGTPHCGQELLVKRILKYPAPRISSNVKWNKISVKAPSLTKEALWNHLSFDLFQQLCYDITATCQQLINKLEEDDVVIIFNDLLKKQGNVIQVLKSFWAELNQNLPDVSPQNRLFMFAIHKSYEAEYNWQDAQISVINPRGNCRTLAPISCLTENALNSWHAGAEMWFPKEDQFCCLMEKKEKILEKPHIDNVVNTICTLLDCHDAIQVLEL